MAHPTGDPGYFDRPENIERLRKIFWRICLLFLALDLVDLFGKWREIEWMHFKHHAHHPGESWPGFYSLYAFIGVTLLVFLSKGLRKIVMRGEDYYEPDE